SGAPTPASPARAWSPGPGRHPAPAAATAPSAAAAASPWPASAARSVRACRSACRTSRSTCPPRRGSPRGPRRAQAALRGLLPHSDLDRGFTEGLGQLLDLCLELLPPPRPAGPARGQAGLPRLEEVRLPPADRLLADPLPPRGLGDRHLASEDAQHDPRLLLHRDHWWSTHGQTLRSGLN